eukprot:140277_1
MSQQTETKIDAEDTTNDDDSKCIEFKAELSNLKGCDSITISIEKTTKIDEISQKINKTLKLEKDKALQYKKSFYMTSIPKSFELKIGTEDIINFSENIFSISSQTRFIEYWNDFLDEAIIFDREEKTEPVEGEIRCDGKLSVKLLKNKILQIGDARIEFQRTLRIPDDNKTYPLPPSLGAFEIAKVQDHMNSDGLPDKWKKRKGCIIPMWQKEAMWINFSCNKPCAVKVGVGKINAVTGKEWKSRNLTMNIDEQNYCAIPKQLWLDGVNCGDGYIRQFVAMPLGKGYTIEHQVKKMVNEKEKQKDKIESDKGDNSNNEVMIPDDIYDADEDEKKEEIFEDVGGIQFEVFPRFDENVHLSVNKNH